MHTSRFDLRRLGIFIFVNHVLVNTLVHELVNLRFHPGGTEGSQILTRVTI